MEISTKYNIYQAVFYLERENVTETCSTCKGKKKINVTNGVHNWNIMCPSCHGKGKIFNLIHYVVVSGNIIKEVITRRNETFSYTKYLLDSGITKSEKALFPSVEEAENKCAYLNDQIERNKKKTQ